jgi:hypothetical protein
MTAQAPFTKVIRIRVPAVATAGNDLTSALGAAEFDGVITSAKYIPDAGLTSNDTAYRTYSIVNKGQAGAGATSMASAATKTSGGGGTGDFTAFKGVSLTLSGTPANLAFASGDVLALGSVHTGTGVADPGGVVEVTLSRS